MNHIIKKRLKLLSIPLVVSVIAIIGTLIFSFLTRVSSASSKISKYDIVATLDSYGDLHVVDTIEFKSDGFHFFEYEIGYSKNILEGSGTQSYFDTSSVKVSVYNKQGKYYFDQETESTPDSSSMYKRDNSLGFSWNPGDVDHEGYPLTRYTSGKNRELIYVYIPTGLDSTIYFKYEYTIKNVINKYSDLSELNWNFASPLEDMKMKNVNLTLNFPSNSDKYSTSTSWDEKGILAFGHGNGQSEITSFTNKGVTTHSTELKENFDDRLELRVVFPNQPYDLFANIDTSDTIDADRSGFEIIKSEEDRLTSLDKRNTENFNAKKNLVIAWSIVIGVVGIAILILLYFVFDKERKPKFEAEYLREPPSKLIPSELSYLIYEKDIVKDAFSATMMSLFRKKYLKIDSNGSVLTDEKANYLIMKNTDDIPKEEMNFDEQKIYSLLFDKLFKGQDQFSMDELEGKLKKEKDALVFDKGIESWKKEAKDKAKALGFYDSLSLGGFAAVLGLLGVIFALYSIFLYIELFLPFYILIFIAISIFISTLVLVYAPSIIRKSKKGIEEYTKWMAFKKFLTDFSHFEDYDMMSVIVWEEYMVYATIFGIADLVEKQMRVKIKDQGPEYDSTSSSFDSTFMTLWYINRMSSRMSTYTYIARQTVIAARTAKAAATAGKIASSGGFGGSSSHGGGGHGGRAG